MNTKWFYPKYRRRAKHALRKLIRVEVGKRATTSMTATGSPRAFDRIYRASAEYERAKIGNERHRVRELKADRDACVDALIRIGWHAGH